MAVIKQPLIIIRSLGCVNGPASYFLLMYAITTNMANTMMTMMCTGNYLFNSLMVFLAPPLLRKYRIILTRTDDTERSSSSPTFLRKSSSSFVALNDINAFLSISKYSAFVKPIVTYIICETYINIL